MQWTNGRREGQVLLLGEPPEPMPPTQPREPETRETRARRALDRIQGVTPGRRRGRARWRPASAAAAWAPRRRGPPSPPARRPGRRRAGSPRGRRPRSAGGRRCRPRGGRSGRGPSRTRGGRSSGCPRRGARASPWSGRSRTAATPVPSASTGRRGTRSRGPRRAIAAGPRRGGCCARTAPTRRGAPRSYTGTSGRCRRAGG
mmetsp:Transcript_32907/g.98168  ORF Transcript_32907/g.98168 Transcript_32907/m.98168 type:complete len:202 (+) Transcript_32907:136-741(+)